jgi:hypothetical protein
MLIFECQSVGTWCDTAPAWLHGRMKCFACWIDNMCNVSFLFVVRRYIKYISVHIYSISRYVINVPCLTS